MKKNELQIIGWREWVCLKSLKVSKIKAKVDSGARTSSLHAFDMKIFNKAGQDYVRFSIHPEQRSSKNEKRVTCKVLEYRKVKSSNGMTEKRPVILTTINIADMSWEIEVTLTNRDEMGFRMLLGRESIRGRFLIHTGKSYLADKKLYTALVKKNK